MNDMETIEVYNRGLWGACPTQCEWKDENGNEYYFRLRHGVARLDKNGEVLIPSCEMGVDGNGEEILGICTWEEITKWVSEKGFVLIEK